MRRIINRFVSEGVLLEYGEVSSTEDSNELGSIKIYIYPEDRPNMTPHCHVVDRQTELEFEVSLIDNRIINIKNKMNKKLSIILNKNYKAYSAWTEKKIPELIKSNGEPYSKMDYMRKYWNANNRNSNKQFDENGNFVEKP